MKRTTPLLLVFDGECPMCVALTRLYLLLGWVPAERRVALQDVDPELLAALTAAGIRNEMAVVEPASRRILTGVPGLFWLLRETWARPIVWVLDRPVLRSVCDVAYRFIDWFRDLGFLGKPGVETKAAKDTAAFLATPPATK